MKHGQSNGMHWTKSRLLQEILIMNGKITMAKKVLVIPDVHGETFWKEPVLKYIDKVDRIIFLGDYLDPYPEEGKDYSPQEIFDNLMDIVELKRNHMEKVVLLKGNHDQHYASE